LIKLLCENFNKLMIRSIPYSTNTKVDAFWRPIFMYKVHSLVLNPISIFMLKFSAY
jgi:hypothetical protein